MRRAQGWTARVWQEHMAKLSRPQAPGLQSRSGTLWNWCAEATQSRSSGGGTGSDSYNMTAAMALVGCVGASAWLKQALATDCEEKLDVNVMTYNVLSPALARPSHYKLTEPELLDVDKRYGHIRSRLDVATSVGTIIGLQEVDLRWAGQLHAFFAERGYCAVFAQYGSDFSNYMGVMVAWPTAKYETEEVEIVRLSDTAPKDTWPKSAGRPPLGGTFTNYEVKDITGSFPPSNDNQFDEWQTARWRKNEAIYVRLKSRASSGPARSFVVGNYHMPCLFGTAAKVRVVNIHSYLLMRRLRDFAKGDPCILLGDFNLKPSDPAYRFIAEGGDLTADKWVSSPEEVRGLKERLPAETPFPTGLTSAYKTFHGCEPLFTNYAQTGKESPFCETLDYIWFTPADFDVVRCPPMPASRRDVRGPFPSVSEPSDHIPLSATLRMH
eukprot:CAMPEP_0178384694 /NCGR_PEP_ID=MMETSP0689_2-20121128/7648_1 /TAXON_ID=160604 /ORGANISM="Amphidinium massartii, Strain CS-259" /LENGTH=438 /DNA_ID=CAMNT_0020004951 /DNA_START=1 /DNA_END=1317 /DNA_ORIENTATION=+